MAGLNPTDVERAIRMVRRVRDAGVSVLLIERSFPLPSNRLSSITFSC
jgi:ABC-type branched-subunit amino acid transport system ATPase component